MYNRMYKWNEIWIALADAARNNMETVLTKKFELNFRGETCRVPVLEPSFLGCCYFDTSESIYLDISNKGTIYT